MCPLHSGENRHLPPSRHGICGGAPAEGKAHTLRDLAHALIATIQICLGLMMISWNRMGSNGDLAGIPRFPRGFERDDFHGMRDLRGFIMGILMIKGM